MLLNPLLGRYKALETGINWTSKIILRTDYSIGIALSFSQVFKAGKYALILMAFTLATAFTVGYL